MRFPLRLLGLSLPLLASIATAQGQTTPVSMSVPASTVTGASFLTRQDTARAVHELFKSRRGGGFIWLGIGSAGMAASIIPARQPTSAGVWTPGVVIGSGLALLGAKKALQFGWGRERNVLQDLAATGHLPADIKRRLRGNFAPLHGTSSEADPLRAYQKAPAATPSIAVTPAAGTEPAAATPTAAPVPVAAVPVVPAPTPAASAAEPATSSSSVMATPIALLTDARTDTLDAIQGYFMNRRSAGALPASLLAPAVGVLASSRSSSNTSSPYAPQPEQASDATVGVGLALLGASVVYMLVHNAPYAKEQLEAQLASYRAGKPLPADLRTHLRPRYVELGRKYRQRLERQALRRSK